MAAMSALNRKELISKIKLKEWDVVVIGGGITGAGIILDASSRGMKTLLLEKHDFAWGTSSRSTKLIHGGLRYLKQMEIGLVREVGLERSTVYKNARHIVRPEKMLLPIVEKGSLGKMTSAIGLWVYDWLADVNKEERRIMLTKEETLAAEEKLNADILIGGGLYYEYRTDDSRLTIEIIKKAVKMGAVALNYAEVTGFEYHEGDINGLHFTDALQSVSYEVKAKSVINATGPWVDKIRKLDEPNMVGKKLRLTKGVHIVIPKKLLNLNQAVYFDAQQGDRMIFCIPRNNIVYMGTTDTDYKADIDEPITTKSDVNYILDAVNHMFPASHLKVSDVISSWAGLRPLIHEEGKSPSEVSRRDEIFTSKNGLISIAGGKLTGYRKMSERIIKEIIKKNETNETFQEIGPARSKDIKVSGNIFESEAEMQSYLQQLTSKHIGYEKSIRQLFFKYGSNTSMILQIAMQRKKEKAVSLDQALHFAEIKYAVENEMVHSLSDFCIRRTGMLYFDPTKLMDMLAELGEYMQEILGWDELKIAEEIQLVRLAHRTAVDFGD
jgi:glycerol-3-phosphate dehydrogenase